MLIYVQSAVAVLLVVAILLQQRGQALGSAFGGEGGGFYATKRGFEKKLYWATIVLGASFVLLSVLNLVI